MKVLVSLAVVDFLIVLSACEDARNNVQLVKIAETDQRDPKLFGFYAVLYGGSRMSQNVELSSKFQQPSKSKHEASAHKEEYSYQPQQHFYNIFFPLFQNFGSFHYKENERSLDTFSEGKRKEKNGFQRNKRSLETGEPSRKNRQNDEDVSNDDNNNSSEYPDTEELNGSTTTPAGPTSAVTPSEIKPNNSYYPPPSGSPSKPDSAWSSHYPPSIPCSHPPIYQGPTYPHSHYDSHKTPFAIPHEFYTYGAPLIEDIHYISFARPPPFYHPYPEYNGHQSFKPSIPDYYQNNFEHQKHTFYPVLHKK